MTETTIKKYIPFGEPISPDTAQGGFGFIPNGIREKNIFFYHPDHLGSSSYITGQDGKVSQHTEYIAFGEILFDEHNTEHTMPYLFNGKELDQETGLYYYGARYYDPKVSIFVNVDPLVEKTMQAYAYVSNNPINLIDPTGMEGEDPPTKAGKYLHTIDYYKFRAQDFEKRNPGKKAPSYYMEYGDYNIRKFTNETFSKLAKKGQQWLLIARDKLQDPIENILQTKNGQEIEFNDSKFTDFAMNTHVKAYWDAGLKDLNIIDLVNIGLTPDIKHLASSKGIEQAVKIGEKLLDHWTSNPSVGAKRFFELGANAFKIKIMINEYVEKQVRNGGGSFDKVYNETRAHLERLIPKFSDFIPTISTEK